MKITSGKINCAVKTLIYGPEGIGKSTLASCFPEPLFIDTEGSTKQLDVRRLPEPHTWSDILSEIRFVIENPDCCKTLVIDTADWAESKCCKHILTKYNMEGIESFGFGKGYVILAEHFTEMLDLLDAVIEAGVNVVLTAHSMIKSFDLPNEIGSYNRFELKLQKKTTPIVKEWADMVLFCNYKTHVVNVDGQGASKGKNIAMGGERVIYTSHNSVWDAKNRFALPEVLPLSYDSISSVIERHDPDLAALRDLIEKAGIREQDLLELAYAKKMGKSRCPA